MSKPKLLFLAHRLPYPPHKGEKLRAYHIMRGLAEDYDLFLGTMIDDPADWEHRWAFDDLCVGTCIADGRDRNRSVAALTSLVKREAVTFSYFRHPALMRWVTEMTTAHQFDAAILYSSGVAPYLAAMKNEPERLIVDFVDADSAKWETLAETSHAPMRQVYAREARLMRATEVVLAQRADASLLVTDSEAALFSKLTGTTRGVQAVGNGVDLPYWQAARKFPSPYPEDGVPRVIFTGAMDYEPNIEAVTLFAEHAMPALARLGREVHFVIAGSNPAREVLALDKQADITVTGRVPDMRPWMAHAQCAIAPLMLARGIQNKVLEAMAAGIPAVVTKAALEGITARDGETVIVADGSDTSDGTSIAAQRKATGEACALAIDHLFANPERTKQIAEAAQKMIAENYSWEARVADFRAVLTRPNAVRDAA